MKLGKYRRGRDPISLFISMVFVSFNKPSATFALLFVFCSFMHLDLHRLVKRRRCVPFLRVLSHRFMFLPPLSLAFATRRLFPRSFFLWVKRGINSRLLIA